MNIFQAANNAALFLVVGAIVTGLARHLADVRGGVIEYLLKHLEIIYLGLFIVVFKVKTWLDDHKHFAEPNQDKTIFRYFGFVLAIFSWIFWGLAAYFLSSTIRASELMAISILISTAWLAVKSQFRCKRVQA